jgi:predicted ATPase
MQLQSLYIKDHKILKDFRIDFKKDVSILIGINGSGKSTILEAIAEIFSCIILDYDSKFDFEFEYILKQNEIAFPENYKGFIAEPIRIRVVAQKGKKSHIFLRLHDILKETKKPKFSQNTDFIPQSIVIYYSGYSDIIKSICEPHIKLLSENYRKENISKPNIFLYYEPALFDIILISLLSYQYGDIPLFLEEKAKIKDVQSIRIRLKKPNWAKQKINEKWGASGKIKSFVEFIDSRKDNQTNNVWWESNKDLKNLLTFLNSKGDNAKTIDMLLSKKLPEDGLIVVEAAGNENLIITIIGRKKLFEIREHFSDEKELFNILKALYIDDMWAGAEFSFIKEDEENYSSFSILSEGEQQAITIRGLTELTSERNTLFLFDEPDTYLHPKWQRNFISEIEKLVEVTSQNENSFLIATHSPQLLLNANPDKTDVRIIEKGKLVELTPKYFGRDISSVLYELMGVEERNESIKNDLSKLFILIGEKKIRKAEKELERLKALLGDNDSEINRAIIQLDFLKEDEANIKKRKRS